ncbi:MAG: hypothetical protein JXA20_07155 [Spirochaetes bacterium]|nr:hypothetical protein [Spirochaetota bacterium]
MQASRGSKIETDGIGRVFTYCPLCLCKGTKSRGTIYITVCVLLAISVVVLALLKVGTVPVVLWGVFCLVFILFLIYRSHSEKTRTEEDLRKFLRGLSWEEPGDADAPVNRLLGLTLEEMSRRGKAIHDEIIGRSDDEPRLHYYLKKSDWTFHDLGKVLLNFKRDIAYWSWRGDLSEKNKNRVSLVFAYCTAVEHLGEARAEEIIGSAPPQMIAPGLMQQLLQQ